MIELRIILALRNHSYLVFARSGEKPLFVAREEPVLQPEEAELTLGGVRAELYQVPLTERAMTPRTKRWGRKGLV